MYVQDVQLLLIIHSFVCLPLLLFDVYCNFNEKVWFNMHNFFDEVREMDKFGNFFSSERS